MKRYQRKKAGLAYELRKLAPTNRERKNLIEREVRRLRRILFHGTVGPGWQGELDCFYGELSSDLNIVNELRILLRCQRWMRLANRIREVQKFDLVWEIRRAVQVYRIPKN